MTYFVLGGESIRFMKLTRNIGVRIRYFKVENVFRAALETICEKVHAPCLHVMQTREKTGKKLYLRNYNTTKGTAGRGLKSPPYLLAPCLSLAPVAAPPPLLAAAPVGANAASRGAGAAPVEC